MHPSLPTWFRRQSVTRKLTTAVVVTTAVLLLAMSAVFVVYDFVTLRARLVRDVTMLADILGTNSTGALTFTDASAATETLSAMSLNRHILTARLLTPDGRLLASYQRQGVGAAAGQPGALTTPDGLPGVVFADGRLLVVRTIALQGEPIGRIEVESDTEEVSTTMARFSAIVAVTLLIAVLLALGLSRATARLIFTPIGRLIEVTRQVRDGRRYDVRAAPGNADEIGELIDGFNAMLSDIQTRDAQLLHQQDDLEHTVNARTAELKASNLELVTARDRAMEASLAKSEFLANMSHEIRTPLNGVIGMTDLVLDSELSAEQRDSLVTVQTSAAALLSILNDVLDFSKIEARKLSLEAVPFSPRAAIAAALKPFALRAHQKGLELICDIAPELPDGVIGDPTRLQQVLTNLVGNALKFTEHGHVLVTVREEARAGNRTTLHFSVTDTGPGIAPDKHAAIFEAFQQADGSTTRRFGGTGLGLAISSTLVTLMGGRIWVESEEGSGSAFHVTVTLDVTAAPELARALPAPPHLDVLIIDDNAVNRRLLSEQMRRWGMTATAVSDGPAGLAALLAAVPVRPFQLVLLDAQMPGMDGFSVAAEIARHPELAGATVMMLSSSGEYGDPARCAAAGIAVYLTKPVYADDLQAAIARVIGTLASTPATHGAKSSVGGLVGKADIDRVRVLLVEDNVVNQKVAIGLLTRRGHQVELATTGLEAVQRLEDEAFDVVLMDLQMPVMGGIEATVAIREHERRRGTGRRQRIVAMTAHAMNSDRDRCTAAGMDGYLSKPIVPQLLFAAVEAGSAVRASEDSLLQRLAGDRDKLADVVRVFIDDLPHRLGAAERAVARSDAAAIQATARAIKAIASNLGAAPLLDAAAAFEAAGDAADFVAAELVCQRLSALARATIDGHTAAPRTA